MLAKEVLGYITDFWLGVRNIIFVATSKKAINILMPFTSFTDANLGMIAIHLFFKSCKKSLVLVNLLCFYLVTLSFKFCSTSMISHLYKLGLTIIYSFRYQTKLTLDKRHGSGKEWTDRFCTTWNLSWEYFVNNDIPESTMQHPSQ